MSHIYTAPIAGMYAVRVKGVKLVATGTYSLQTDYFRKWYQFWKPKLILKPDYRSEITHDYTSTKYYNQGELIATLLEPKRIEL